MTPDYSPLDPDLFDCPSACPLISGGVERLDVSSALAVGAQAVFPTTCGYHSLSFVLGLLAQLPYCGNQDGHVS